MHSQAKIIFLIITFKNNKQKRSGSNQNLSLKKRWLRENIKVNIINNNVLKERNSSYYVVKITEN